MSETTSLSKKKFSDPYVTRDGEERASVQLSALKTLWFNTGTQCNLQCPGCYIESSPKNDRLQFLTLNDVQTVFEDLKNNSDKTGTPTEVGFTGGEPFLNPHFIDILEHTLEEGFEALVLTNAHRLIDRYKDRLVQLKEKHGSALTLRVSLDSHLKEEHEKERGPKTFDSALRSLQWLDQNGFKISIAGRALFENDIEQARQGYRQLLREWEIQNLNVNDPEQLVIFPEMDTQKEVPEITTQCWSLLGRSPEEMMCSSSRMIVKRKGNSDVTVLPCTLLAYDTQFDLGHRLSTAESQVQLNHPFCAQFCVLGGASCS